MSKLFAKRTISKKFVLPFNKISKTDFSILLSNCLSDFDSALYSFLAPLLGPLFFPEHETLTQLILIYSILSTSLITRPLGTIFFGIFVRNYNPLLGLYFSLLGFFLSTLLVALVPGYATIGSLSIILLIAARACKGFFAAGENTIAKIYIMEGKEEKSALKISHWYQFSTMLGIILASSALNILLLLPNFPNAWRFCFIGISILGFLSLMLRLSDQKNILSTLPRNYFKKITQSFFPECKALLHILSQNRATVFKVALINGFSWLTYGIPFVFLNNFVPLVTDIGFAEMMTVNSYLLIIDVLLIPIIGRITLKFDSKPVMIFSSFVLSISIIPLFIFMSQASFLFICFVRFWIIFWGIVFLCPATKCSVDWLSNNVNNNASNHYFLIGIGSILGSNIGRLTPAICLSLWQFYAHPISPALYITFFIAVTFLILNPFSLLFSHLKSNTFSAKTSIK